MVRLKTLPEALELAADKNTGGFSFLGKGGQSHHQPFRDLLNDAQQVAGSLRQLGLRSGDVVGISVPAPGSFLTAFLGASYAGFIPTPLCPPPHAGNATQYIQASTPMINASGAKGVVTTSAHGSIFESIRSASSSLSLVAAVETLTGAPLTTPHPTTLDTPAFVQFTSGSASTPKGVVLTHRNLAANIEAIVGPAGLAIEDDDIGVSWLPLFHDLGLIGMALATLYRGIRTHFIPPSLFLKRPVEWLRAISQYQGTVSFAPSFAYDLCVRRISDEETADLNLSSWRVAGCGAEPIQASALEAFAAKFARVGFRDGSLMSCYGMAEHTLAVTFSPLGKAPSVDTVRSDALTERCRAVPCSRHNPKATAIVNCGRAFPGHTLQVVDSQSRPLADRQVGEIVLTGPSVMNGYLIGDGVRRETIRDGRFHTGDLGYLVDGELRVCGRLKDTIIVNGRNYFPQDIEWAVAELSGIRKGRVVAFGTTGPDERDRVVVVVGAGKSSSRDILATRIRRQILETLGISVDDVVLVANNEIPRTTSGKLQRNQVRAAYEAAESDSPVEWSVEKRRTLVPTTQQEGIG